MIYKTSRQTLTVGGRSGHDQDPLAKDERQDRQVDCRSKAMLDIVTSHTNRLRNLGRSLQTVFRSYCSAMA